MKLITGFQLIPRFHGEKHKTEKTSVARDESLMIGHSK